MMITFNLKNIISQHVFLQDSVHIKKVHIIKINKNIIVGVLSDDNILDAAIRGNICYSKCLN